MQFLFFETHLIHVIKYLRLTLKNFIFYHKIAQKEQNDQNEFQLKANDNYTLIL